MLYRKALEKIDYWFNNSNSALLVTGPRQVGKTYLINYFLSNNTKSYVSFNLLENLLAREIFNTSIDTSEIILKLSLLSKNEFINNETVIFIDEIQEANDAVTVLKFLVQNTKYRYIVSGSLLGVELQNIRSIPAGYLEVMNMYPLDFEEFIKANKVNDKIIEYLKNAYSNNLEIDKSIHKRLMSLFNLYLIIGGFPEAVNTYIEYNDLKKVRIVHEKIDFAYKADISKYDKENSFLIKDIYNIIPSELNNQNKRMILKNINNKSRFYLYETSFTWLLNSGIGLFTYNVDAPKFPLLSSKERTLFKLFLCDVGLLSYQLFDEDVIRILNGDVFINHGSLYENVVAQELISKGYDLYYYNSKKYGEVDFLIENNGQVLPIQIKSGKDYKRHSALNNIIQINEYRINKSIVFSNDNIKVCDKIIYYPIYMIMFLDKKKTDSKELIYKVDLDGLV